MSKPASAFARIEAIDALRGLALVGMFVFHASWDLAYFGFVPEGFITSPGFMLFGHVVACIFLALAGVSLVLAMPDGRPKPATWRRLGQIVLAAAAITALTYWMFPDAFIFFGILHCIALGSLIGLALLRLPMILPLALGLAIIAAPHLVSAPLFNEPWLTWVGLGTRLPRTYDWRPVFPWLGFVLLGLAGMKAAAARDWPATWARWHARNGVARLLCWGGRHSLAVYLVHQPILFGLAWVLAQVLTPSLPASAVHDPFVTSCISQCVNTGATAPVCTKVCGCISDEVRRHPATWQRLVSNALSPRDRVEIDAYTQQCVRGDAPAAGQ